MAADVLESELLAIVGVAGATVEHNNGNTPLGVKVRLHPDADPRQVGIDVQRVLAAHGMRSRFATGATDPTSDESQSGAGGNSQVAVGRGAAPAPVAPTAAPPVSPPSAAAPIPPPPTLTPPLAPAPVPAPPQVVTPPTPPAPVAAPAQVVTPPTSAVSAAVDESVVQPSPGRPSVEVVSVPELGARVTPPQVQAVTVEERSDGLTVSVVMANGRKVSRDIGPLGEGLDAAVIGAVTEAVGEPVTRAAVEWIEIDDGSIVTVVLKRQDGLLTAGAGVMRVSRAFAIALATRAALAA